MNALGSILAFGAGCLCLGITFTLGLLFAIANRSNDSQDGSGCFGAFLCSLIFGGAIYFFVVAFRAGLPVTL